MPSEPPSTDLLKAELTELKRRLRHAQNLAGLGQWSVDLRDQSADWDRSLCELLKYDYESVKPSLPTFLSMLLPEDRDWVVNQFGEQRAKGDPFSFWIRAVCGDEEVRYFNIYVEFETDGDGQQTHMHGTVQDVTAIKALESKLQQRHKMETLGRLTSGIAHDFNNILTAINIFGGFIRDRLEPDDELMDDVQEIIKATERATTLTRQLLAFGRPRPASAQRIDVGMQLQDLRMMLGRLCGEHVDLHFELPRGLWKIRMDPGHFDQILTNLVINARDAMPQGGQIAIKARNIPQQSSSDLNQIEIQVMDTGIGMDQEVLDRLFDPFFTTKAPQGGTGLGLATCQELIQEANGTIEVTSILKKGSVFTIRLPRAGASLTRQSQEIIMPTQRQGQGTILVVEDDEHVLHTIKRSLENRGYSVLEARTPGDALWLFEQNPDSIGLLLTDVLLPQTTGLVLAQRTRLVKPELPVIFMSGYDQSTTERYGLQKDLHTLLSKPFTSEALLHAVQNALKDHTKF